MRPKTLAWYLLLAAIVTFVLLVCMSASGCVSAGYNPTTGAITYMRVGNMQLDGVTIRLADGSTVTIGGSNSETKIAEAALNIAAAARNLSEVVK